MHVLITGGTGLIGSALCQSLAFKGAQLTVLTRDIQKAKHLLSIDGVHFIEQVAEIKPDATFDAVVNLAGAPIAKFWTENYKQTLLQSRVVLTQSLVAALATLTTKPKVLVSGSAIGFYGPQGDNELIETSSGVASFSHELCQAWEASASDATKLGIRVVNLRTGVVLSKKDGALAKMRLPFSLGLGGPIGSGEQWMSWVHHDDIVNIILFCIQEEDMQGPVNATAPNPVTNKTFAQIYGKVLHRPAILPMPAWFLKMVMGQMAEELLITGQRVVPSKLNDAGFVFTYPELEGALKNT